MFWGLLIALVLTVATAILATSIKPMKKAGLLSWVVLAVGALVLWFTAGRMVEAIQGRHDVKIVMNQASSELDNMAARELDSDIYGLVSGLGLSDAFVEGAGSGALHYYSVRIWTYAILSLVVVAAMLLGFILFMQGGGGGRRPVASTGRRAPRNSNRARRY